MPPHWVTWSACSMVLCFNKSKWQEISDIFSHLHLCHIMMDYPLTVCGTLDVSHKRKKSLLNCQKNIIFEKIQAIIMAFNLHLCNTCVLHYFCRMGLRGKEIFKFAKFIYKKTFIWLDYKKYYMCLTRNMNCILFVSTWIHHPGFGWRSYC